MTRLTLAFVALLAIVGTMTGQPTDKPHQIPTPKGWREESMPMPPRFAAGMTWRGTEELRFAPGMYREGSDSFLSYAFLCWLAADPPTDARAIERELLAYFRGLAKGVMPRRLNKEADVDAFTLTLKEAAKADKRPTGETVTAYAGELQWTEPFVTGKPQTLRLDIHTWKCEKAKHSCVFVLASPQPDSAAVWKTLREIRADTKFP
jgi:hypothetical protein